VGRTLLDTVPVHIVSIVYLHLGRSKRSRGDAKDLMGSVSQGAGNVAVETRAKRVLATDRGYE